MTRAPRSSARGIFGLCSAKVGYEGALLLRRAVKCVQACHARLQSHFAKVHGQNLQASDVYARMPILLDRMGWDCVKRAVDRRHTFQHALIARKQQRTERMPRAHQR